MRGSLNDEEPRMYGDWLAPDWIETPIAWEDEGVLHDVWARADGTVRQHLLALAPSDDLSLELNGEWTE